MKIKICEKKQHVHISDHHDVHLKYLITLNGGGENTNKYFTIFQLYLSKAGREKKLKEVNQTKPILHSYHSKVAVIKDNLVYFLHLFPVL